MLSWKWMWCVPTINNSLVRIARPSRLQGIASNNYKKTIGSCKRGWRICDISTIVSRLVKAEYVEKEERYRKEVK